MKYLLAVILSISFSFAQSANGKGSNLVMNVSIDNNSIVLNYLKIDLNADGNTEILRGERIVKLNKNEIWVKNTELTSESGDIYYFGNKLKKNDVNVMNQVISEHGYILVAGENDLDYIVYISDKNGSKNSDPISILIK